MPNQILKIINFLITTKMKGQRILKGVVEFGQGKILSVRQERQIEIQNINTQVQAFSLTNHNFRKRLIKDYKYNNAWFHILVQGQQSMPFFKADNFLNQKQSIFQLLDHLLGVRNKGVTYRNIFVQLYDLNLDRFIYAFSIIKSIVFQMEKKNKPVMLTLEQQANQAYEQYRYEEEGLRPCAYFWKELTHGRETPQLLIPDTLIVNDKQQPLLWIYTNSEGRVEANSNVSLKDFVNKVTSFCSPNELTATMKRLINKQGHNNFGNDVKLLNSRYLHNLSMQHMGDQVITIQKYIKSHGKRAFVCRTIYSAESHPFCFLITNKSDFYDQQVAQNKRFLVAFPQNNISEKKLTIVKSVNGRHLQQTLPYLKQIVKYMSFQRGVNLTQLVADFIKDQQGNWWLVNIKAFKVEQKLKLNSSLSHLNSQKLAGVGEKEKYQRTKQCRYCQKSYLQSELTHKLTKKMLLETDRYLLHLGKNYKWLARSDANIDSHCLYQQCKVCQRCYRLYIEIQALLAFQGKFLKKLAVTTQADPKDLLMRLTSKDELQVQSKDKQIMNLRTQIPQQISLGPNSSIITRNNRPLRNDQTIHEMVRYRFILYLHQLDQLTGIKQNTNYFIDFGIFGTKFKFKLDVRPGMKSTPVKKLRLCYFFIPTGYENNNIQEYIQQHKYLKINLIAQNRQNGERRNAGSLNLDLRQFLILGRKSFYKFLDTQAGFGWGLEGSIGLIRTEKEVNTSRLILSTQDRLIYLPSQHYYLCEPLPQQWMAQIQNKNKANPNLQTMIGSNFLKPVCDTSQQFIPQQTFQKQKKERKSLNWKIQLLKEIKNYSKG